MWGPIMRWSLALLATAIALTGCSTTPKREMRPPKSEEMYSPPAGQYTTPRDDIPRDTPLLAPKGTPNLNTNGPGRPGVGAGMMPTNPR